MKIAKKGKEDEIRYLLGIFYNDKDSTPFLKKSREKSPRHLKILKQYFKLVKHKFGSKNHKNTEKVKLKTCPISYE